MPSANQITDKLCRNQIYIPKGTTCVVCNFYFISLIIAYFLHVVKDWMKMEDRMMINMQTVLFASCKRNCNEK